MDGKPACVSVEAWGKKKLVEEFDTDKLESRKQGTTLAHQRLDHHIALGKKLQLQEEEWLSPAQQSEVEEATKLLALAMVTHTERYLCQVFTRLESAKLKQRLQTHSSSLAQEAQIPGIRCWSRVSLPSSKNISARIARSPPRLARTFPTRRRRGRSPRKRRRRTRRRRMGRRRIRRSHRTNDRRLDAVAQG